MTHRVLVVDDSPTIRKIVAAILEDNGYDTCRAENGEEALEVLRRETVDLVLTDFVMPRMNGYQFCREVRADRALQGLPIVLMSAKGDKIRGQFVEQTGAVDAITKPFDPLGLLAVVERALSRKEELLSRPTIPDEDEPSSFDRNSFIDLSPSSLELSEDPGLRRIQIAQEFGVGVSKIVAPQIFGPAGLPASEGELADRIRSAMTPERLSGLAGLLRSLDFGPEAAEILTGDLSVIGIPEILQLLELQRQTGALIVSSPRAEITLFIREGLLDFARGRGVSNAFRLGRYLVSNGSLSRSDLAHFLDNRAGSKRLIGDALVQLALVTEKDIERALVVQTSELVYEVVGWRSGRFAFVKDATTPEATLAQLGLPPGAIVMEGFRRVDEWRRIEGSFDFDETLHRDQLTIDRLSDKLTDSERAILDAIDGTRTVREVVDAVDASTFDICKTLYQLLNSHLVRRRAA